MILAGQSFYSRRRVGVVLTILLLLGLIGSGAPAFADGPSTGTADRQIEELLAAKSQRTPAQRKISSQLLNTASDAQLAEADGSEQPPTAEGSRQPRGSVASVRQQAVGPDSVAELELVTVDIRATVTAAVLARIRALGGTVINSVPEYRAIRARLPLTAVEQLAALDAVQFIRPADEAVTRKDNTSEGDIAHGANLARTRHGVTGAGIGIGVISDGVGTLADRQASGDLPARVTVLPGQEGSGDEGTALLEIVHDIAPGAELYFATGFTGQAQFAANIEALCEAGADVIVDDVGYPLEANLQDDLVAQGVNAATADGCYFFSAAGNDGNLNDGTSGVWEGDYAAGTSLVVGGETAGVRHDFGGGQEENPIKGSFYGTVVLQWSDPLGNSANDYDLFLVDGDGNVISSSTNTQDGSQDPFESISTGFFAYSDARLVIVKVKGDNRYLRLQAFDRNLEIATAGNTWGHAAAENAVGVGQVDVRDAGGAGGVFDGTESVRTSSSDGPRRVFFQPDGTPITAGDSTTTGGQEFQELSKPDLAAAACVSTATPGFSRFCGTSAAAAHAAAIAALMLEAASGPGHVTLAELREAMAGAALDIEATGVDRDSGAGIVMTPGAVTAVAIAQANRNGAPTVTDALADRTLPAGSDAVIVDLASTFTDPDSDTLSYSAVSSDPDRLAVTLSGTVVTLTPGSPGWAVVRVRVTDPGRLGALETFTVTVTAGNTDYDKDNDGLIEVTTLAQLDAIRYDLNGDGLVDGATWEPYYAETAFSTGALEMGCPDGCVGYELSADLDFDTDGSGIADSPDTYWNDGAGWEPIGSEDAPFIAVFNGDRRTLANLFINRPTEDGIGLFGEVQSAVTGRGVIWYVGLINVDVTGRDAVGSLFGRTLYGVVIGSHASGRVAGGDQVGGLVGESWGNLIDTYAAVDVSGNQAVGGLVGHHLLNRITTSYATGRVSGAYAVGGLVGATSDFYQLIQASYATGDVSGQGARLSPSDSGFIVCGFVDSDSAETSTGGGVGGLVGSSCGIIEASYATGTVSGDVAVGGLVGSGDYVRAPRSYWDMETSGLRVGVGADDTNDNGVIDGTELQRVGVAGLATAALQSPTGYEGIYGRWNVDLGGRRFGDDEADEPWDFGTSTQYPVLSVDLSGDDTETWQEFGYQFRTRFSLSATTADGQAQVNLSWDAADVSPWKPAPSVTYTVYRDDGSTAAAVAEDLTGTEYADTDVTTGDRYTYWVAAVIAGGEVVRSTAAPVTAGAGNQPPLATGTLADVTLLLGADPVAVDVAGAFRDPDDDSLRHTAATSDASVAAVSVLGSPVTITPVGAGRAIVTVTATDAVGSNPSATQRFRVTVGNDYDTDDDRLIEIWTLAQVDAMRHNLNGQSVPDDDAFALAFPESIDHWGCGFDGCSGYELEADLDFDTDGSGDAGAGDTYWNDGAGWAPIGVSEFRSFGAFNTTFDGNDHVIANLFVRGADQAGLFGGLGQSGVIRNLSVIDVDVVGVDSVGGLVGHNYGAVIASGTTGKVSGDDGVGGLVGENDGTITRSHSFATASSAPQPPACSPSPCVVFARNFPGIGGLVGVNNGAITSSYATGAVDGYPAGGLVGYSDGVIVSSYATGPVTGSTVGGLVGRNGRNGRIYASYATGRVSGGLDVGGLVGTNANLINSSYATGPVSRRSSYGGGLVGNGGHLVGASYWDSTTSGISSSRDRGNTTAELQAPIGYNGIYQSWNLDLYGDSARDDPWDFGTTTQYPALSVDFDGDGQATWQEFGHQLRAGPALTADAKQGQAVLAWSAVASGHWTPPPGITYNIYRSKDTTVKTLKTLVENLDALEYTDPDVTDGPYIYQVAAVADGGQATHSARVAASSASNTAPEFPSSETGVRSIPENTAAGVDIGAAVAAIDAEDDPLTYSLDAAGAGFFAIDSSTGQLKTKAPLDYEKTKTHTFTLTVSDYAASDTTTVRVNVTNAEDPGTVTLLPAQPQVGAKLTAGLTDPDTVSGSVGWSWERSPNSTGPWTAISNATSASYTPRADDLNRYLRATASYNDGLGTGRSASGVSANAVAPRPPNTSLSPSASDPSADPSTVVYTVTFEGQWTAAATPGGVPDGAHFSRLIGAVHNSGVTFLRSGGAASAGVESMAEDGGWTGLRDEVMDAGSNALSVLTGDTDNIRPTTSKALTVTLTADHPRVTLLTMVAPSPDWFVGVSGLTLLYAGGDWVESLQVDLFPWDAGTEEGSGFSLSNSATSPQGVITNLRGTGKFSNARIATLTFTRQSVNTAPTGTPTFIGAQRVGEVLRVDTSSIEDLDGLTNPDFRFTWLADDDLMELGSYLRALSCCDGYEIAPYDAGMTIKVQIHFDDDLGNHEVIDLQAPSTVAAAAPDQPGNLSASLGGPGELNLSWSTPAVCDFTLSFDCWLGLDRTFNVGDGGSDITGYTVQWKLSSGDWGTASDVSEVEISETSYTITGLVSSNTYTVRVRAENVAGLGTPSTEVTVSGASLNAGPVVSGRASPYFFEPSPRDVTTYTATDPESDGITWSLSGDDASFFSIANGVLNFDSAGDFEDPQDVGGNNAYDLNVLASDGQNTATFPVTVVIHDVEDERPVITGDDALTFAEGTDTTTVLQTYSATDPEGVNTSFAWSLYGTDSGDFDISDAGALTFKNVPDFDSPADADGDNVYTIWVRAEDATKTGRLDVTVTVTNVNEAPTTPTGRDAITVAENTAGNLARYAATDPDKDDTVMWEVSGTDANSFRIDSSGNLAFNGAPNYENPTDSDGNNVYEVSVDAKDAEFTSSLEVTVTVEDVDEPPEIAGATTIDDYDENGTGIVATYTAANPEGASTITWTLGGTDRGDFDITGGVLTFKSAPDYERSADSGRNNEYRIQIRANDGSRTGTRNVTVIVNDVNEEPAIVGDATLSYPENTATTRVLDRYSATDPEGRQITWSVTGTDEDSFRIDGSGNLYFVDQPDYDASSDSGGDNEYNIQVVATDDGNLGDGTPSLLGTLSSSFDVAVTVTAVNEQPTVDGEPQLTIFENDEDFSASYLASDPDGVASTITWSVAGADRGDFNIDRNTGELTFRNTPNYESPTDSNRDNVYVFTVRATDEGGLDGSLDVTVMVENVDERPTITGSATPPDFPENSVRSVATYQATDPEGRTIAWDLSGTDGDAFNIDQGALTFKNIPDFEKPTDFNQDNEYLVTVQATDEGGNPASLGVTVTVINSAGVEEPSITTTSRPSLTLQENGTGTIYTFRARDPQGRPVFWSLTGDDWSNFTISDGVLTFDGLPDFEDPADANGDNVYELTVVVTDDQGLTDSFDFTVTVTNHHENREPAITTSPSSGLTYQKLHYQENLISTVHTYRARNYGPGSISWTLRGLDFDSFDISELGALTFKSAPNHEEPGDSGGDNDYEIAVVASNSGGYSDRLNVVITVTDVNEGPEVTGGQSSFTISENQDLPSAVYTGFDPEGDTVTRWTVGGTDGGDFTISQEGVLTFRNTPDFERPVDSNRDNTYELQVRPYDGRYYGSFDVTVTVNDVNEPPAITTTSSSATALRQNENVTSRLYTYRATDPEGADTVTWSVEGVDARFFDIDEGGQFSFKEDSSPDYEQPADSGRDNVYNVEIQAADSGGIKASLDVTVTVRDVNEGPEISQVGSAPGSVPENQDQLQVLARYTATDPEGGTVSRWRTSGSDGGDFVINEQGELRFRNTPDYERPADSNRDNVYVFTVQASDGRNYGSFEETVTVTPVNEPPAITTTSSSATALWQNENVTSRLYTYRATDPEGADTVTWSVGGVDARFFDIDERGQFSFKADSPPDFERPADSDRDNVYNVEIQAEDSGGIKASLDVTVTVRDVNEGPEVTGGRSSFTISENQDLPSAVYTGFDPEGDTVTRWTVGGTDGGDFTISQEGVLAFRNTPDFERPADSNRDNIYQLQVRPYDGRYYGSFDVTVTVTDVNEPPAITTTSSSATALRQNENVTSRLYTYRATDPEGADTVTWSVGGVDARFFDIDEGAQFSFKEENAPDFEQPADSGKDNVYNVEIQAEDSGGIKASLPVRVTVENDAEGVEPTITTRRPPATYRENGTSAVYTFRASEPQRGPISWSLEGADSGDFIITGVGSGRAVLAFSSPPDYEKPADSDGQNDYELTVIATDEDGHVDRLSFTITVTEVDEGPEVKGPSAFTIAENGSLSNAVYTATDPEGSNVARWSVGGRDGGDFFITQGGTLYFRSPPDYERPADSNRNNEYEVTIQPSDGRNNGAYPVTVTVTNVNEPPEIRSGSKTSFMQQENRTSRLHTYSATDPEGGTVTWLVAGTDDGRLFTIDARGQFSFREENPPDFDDPADVDGDNLYKVTIQARDPEFNTASLPVTVTVTEVNEGPVITRDGNLFGSPPGSVPENTPVTQVLATYTATDPERPGVQITQWSTTGRDGGDFVINALGQLMFRNPPDYERPADSNRDNVYEVTIRASDGRNTGTLEEVQRVTVTDVNEAPTITTTSRTSFSQPENRTSTLYTFRATDPEGGTVTWAPGGTDGSAFTIDERGALFFTNPPDYERPADSDRDNVYEVTIQASDVRNRDTLDVTVTVTDHNEEVEPTISTRRPPATYRENDTRTVYTFRATDPQRGATITWTLEGTDAADFTITPDSNGRGVLAFISPPDFESPADADRDNVYDLAVVATDDDGNSDRVDFAIAVTDHNEGVEPTISTRRPPSTYRENDTRTVYTFRASDPQRDTVTWSLSGADSGDFTIDRGTGVLAFSSPPDYENPEDSDRGNDYELTVIATDEDDHVDSLSFTITVTDVNEGPVITLEGTETTTVSENTPDTKVLADYTARDPEDTTANIFRWSTAGQDGGDFVISDLGELRFRSSPDYERPADSNRDNVYEVTVRAYDGRVYGAHDVTVTVAQVNEAPVITTKSRTEFTLRENFTAVLYTYRATDQDEDDAVTWSVEGADGGDFAIYNGILNFRLLPDLENPADEDEDNVYEITVVAADRAGLRDAVDAVITITDQSEGPVIAGTRAYTVEENYDIAQVLGSYKATDAKDNRPVFPRWSLSGRDGGDFTINEDGELTFRNIPDYDRPADSNRDNVYEVTVRGHDSRAYGNLNVTVTVTPVNEHDPLVTGRETLSFRENTAVETRLHTYRATDGDRDTSFTWSLEGDDAGDFLIDEGGVLTFSAPPDYEQPADRDEDNVYQVTVVASDGANRGTLGVTVTVTEQNEGPVVSGAAEFTVAENRDLPSSAVYTARDPEAVGGVTTTIRWSVSGRDGGDFTIDRDTGVLAFRTPPDHERPADANRDNVYEVTVRAHDGRNYGDFQVTVTVEDVAEITGPTALTRTENFEGLLATYLHAGQGDLDVDPSWRLTGADSGDFTIDRESGELTFRSIPDHERPADSNRDNAYGFTVQVADGSYHGTLDVTVTVTAVNEPPAVTGRDSLSFRENTPVTTRLHTYRATDPEGDGFTWRLGGLDASDFTITTDGSGRGVLTFSSPPNFDNPGGSGAHGNQYLVTVQAWDAQGETGEFPVTVTVTDQNEGAVVTGQQTIAVEENRDPTLTLHTYLASDPEGQPITRWSLSGRDGGDFLISGDGELTFRNTPDYDRPADSDRDNEYLVTVRAYDGRTYGNLDVTITVSNVNEHAPVIRSGSRTSFTYREEGTAALYTYRATDGDKDDTITWTTEGTDGGDFTIDGDTGELTFREPPDYEAPGDSGRDNQYNLTVVATDSGRQSASLDVTVTVTAVDEGPEITGTTTYTVPEGQGLAGATFTARDPEDAGAAVSSWRLAGSDAGDFTITDTGPDSAQLTFRNTPDYDRPADSNRDNEYLVTIRAYNGSTYGSLDVTVTVTDRNEAEPVVTGRDTLSFRENTATTTRLHTYRATDTDRDATITWSVSGTDGGDFTISTGGELFFSDIPDHERAADSDSDNVYEITVVASDGTNRGTMAVTVTVTDVNEGPEITGTQSLSFAENTASDRVLATYTATDPEDPDLEITRWSVTGPDGGHFAINEDGDLTFRNPPDHERPADSGRDNVYEITVRASDGRVYGTHDVTVTVEAVDEAPEFRRGSKDSFSYRENGTAALYTYRATDPEGAEVAWSVSGADGGAFTIDRNTGVLNFREPPDHDNPADDGRDNEYQVTVVATDQTGRAANLPVTVTVTDVNEGPEIAETGTNTAITVRENHDEVLATYTATDPEDQPVTRWSVTGRDGGDFSINESGELTFRNPPDHERPADSNRDSVYEVTIRASDGRYYGTLNVTVTVLAVDEAPEFQRNTQDSFVYPENSTSAIYTYRATDPEGSAVAWDLSGTDSSAFSIGKTGVLTFNSPPDYEAPTDSDRNNVYELTVEASDEQSNPARLDVTVTVTNLTDARAVIRGTAQVGRTLTAETSGIPDEDRRDKVDFSYQWLGDDKDIEGATDSTYEITEKDEGKAIKVRVTFTDNAGKEETLTSAATAPVKPAQSNEPATGLPTINGTAQVGETLTADTSGISDADGMTNAVFRYQWTRWDSDTDEDIEGATDSTYEVSDEDEGKTIRLRVGFSDDRGNDEALTSAATGAVAARPAQLTATFPASPFQSSRHKGDDDRPQVIVAFNLPVQSFDKTTPSVSLTGATVSSLVRHEEDGLENAWVFFLDPEGNDVVVFTLVAGQSCDGGGICTGEGKMLSEGGTTTLPGPDEEDKPDNTDSSEPNSPVTGAPTITGAAQLGETLTANTSGVADADGLSNVQYDYQWLADDAEIAGATGSTYTLAAADEGKAIKVRVTFTDDAGNVETLTSAATDALAGSQPTEPPTKPRGLSATASHDSVTLTWDDPGDDTITGYVILRRVRENDVGGEFSVLVPDTGSPATTYTDDTVVAGITYTYRIKAINGAGTSERSHWFHIDTPAAPIPAKPTGLLATATHDRAVLTWDAPGDDSITGYVILRRNRYDDPSGHFDELVADTGTATTTYTDDTVKANTHYTYRINAINEHGGVSERSRWFHIETPACTLDTGDIWCGVVTVAAIEHNNATVAYGFLDDTNIGAGDLDGEPGDETFSVGTNGYTIVGIFVGSAGSIGGVLHFYLDDDLSATDKANLELHVDGASAPFAFSDAAKLSGTDGSNNWSMSGLDWSSETTVTVRLRPATTE